MSKKVDKTIQKVNRTFKLQENVASYIKDEAERQGMTQSEMISNMFRGSFALVEFEETTGKVSMKWWKPEGFKAEQPTDTEEIYKLYRQLRDSFEPVSAGINYHKKFAVGGGFVTEVRNHWINMRKRCGKS